LKAEEDAVAAKKKAEEEAIQKKKEETEHQALIQRLADEARAKEESDKKAKLLVQQASA